MAQASQMLSWASWGLEKSRKRPFSPLAWYPFVFLIKTLSDPLLCAVTDIEHRNSAIKNQNVSE